MTRTTVTPSDRAWSELWFANHAQQTRNGTDVSQLRRFDRSDVTKVTMVDGWRKPTAYDSNDVTTQPPVVLYRRDYLTGSDKGEYRLYSGPATLYGYSAPAARSPNQTTWNACYFMALQRAKDGTMNLAVSLAELGESIELVRSRSKLFGELFDLAKAKRWRELLQHLGIRNYSFKKGSNDVAGRWMELNFGWMPILSDIYAAVDTIGRKARTDGLMVVARATITETPRVSRFNLPLTVRVRQAFGNYLNAYLDNSPGRKVWVNHSQKEGHRVNLWFRVDNAKLQLASALGLTNPASVVWELTRLSWFFDFFVNVGNWIDALDTLGLEFRGGTSCWWYTAEDEIQSISDTYLTVSVKDSLSGGEGLYRRQQSKRTVVTGSPSPFSLKNPFQVWKAATTLALVRQKFR